MVGFEISVRVGLRQRTEFLQAFNMVKTDESGYESRANLSLYEEVGRDNTFLWIEHWKNQESLELYLEGNTFRIMMGAIEVLGELIYRYDFSIRSGYE